MLPVFRNRAASTSETVFPLTQTEFCTSATEYAELLNSVKN